VDPERVEVLAYSPTDGKVILGIDDPTDIGIGSVISERLDTPLTIQAYTITIERDRMRAAADVRLQASARSRLADLLAALVGKLTDGHLHGIYRYRTTRMVGDRVELQSADPIDGLPDLLLVPQWPGVAGTHTTLAAACEVLVQFIGGDRKRPVVTNYVGKGGVGAVPELTEIAGGGRKLGLQGDLVEAPMLGMTVMFDTVSPSGSPTPMLTNTPYVLGFGTVITPPVPGTLQANPGSMWAVLATGTSKATCGD
jgi:hypothetical protein